MHTIAVSNVLRVNIHCVLILLTENNVIVIKIVLTNPLKQSRCWNVRYSPRIEKRLHPTINVNIGVRENSFACNG